MMCPNASAPSSHRAHLLEAATALDRPASAPKPPWTTPSVQSVMITQVRARASQTSSVVGPRATCPFSIAHRIRRELSSADLAHDHCRRAGSRTTRDAPAPASNGRAAPVTFGRGGGSIDVDVPVRVIDRAGADRATTAAASEPARGIIEHEQRGDGHPAHGEATRLRRSIPDAHKAWRALADVARASESPSATIIAACERAADVGLTASDVAVEVRVCSVCAASPMDQALRRADGSIVTPWARAPASWPRHAASLA